MDKVIIVGVYEFLGFHLCLQFLEQGFEVIGVHMETNDADYFLEEKQLLIGRNGNFTEEDLFHFTIDGDLENTYVFIDYYSYYFKRIEAAFMSALQHKLVMKSLTKYVVLVPIQLCGERNEFNMSFLHSHDREIVSYSFYLPTIYGPWQPLEYSLQQSFFHPNKPILLNEREWTEDAIYIDDTIEAIYRQLEKNGIGGSYLLKSTIENHWKKMVNELEIQEASVTNHRCQNSNKDVIVLSAGQTELEDGIEKQRAHLYRLLEEKR